MIIDLAGRKAVVSGSTGGIGRAIAEGLARAGASVVINGRGEERVAAALQEMRAAIPEVKLTGWWQIWRRQRASRPYWPAARCRHPRQQPGDGGSQGLRALKRRRVAEPLPDQCDERCAHDPPLSAGDGEAGLGSRRLHLQRVGLNIPKEMIDYAMTKLAQLAISRGLAEQVGGSGVTVNAVLPGPTRSEDLGR